MNEKKAAGTMKPPIKWTLVCGGMLVLGGPLLGLLGTVIGMMSCFHTLGAEGTADVQGLSSGISGVLIFSVVGFILGGVGIVVMIAGLIAFYRSRKQSIPPSLPA
jgi:biopolymer transport protein ExbB/TolQ